MEHSQKSSKINPRHTASVPAINHKLHKKSEDGYLQIHRKYDPKAGKPLPPLNKRHNESITSTQSMPAYIHRNFKPPNMEPNLPMINDSSQHIPDMHRPHSHIHPMSQRNQSMPHSNMPNLHRFNTVPHNAQLRNMSMPYAMSPMNNGYVSPNVGSYGQPMSLPIKDGMYGYKGVIELGQPVISETWATGPNKKESIVKPSSETYKEPLLVHKESDEIDYGEYTFDDKSEKGGKSNCCVLL